MFTVTARWLDGSEEVIENCITTADVRWNIVQAKQLTWRDINVMKMEDGNVSSIMNMDDEAPERVFINVQGDEESFSVDKEQKEEEWTECLMAHASYCDTDGVRTIAEKIRMLDMPVRSIVRTILSRLVKLDLHSRYKNVVPEFSKALGREMLNARDSENSAIIHEAAWARNVDMVQLLLKAEANINVWDDSRSSALHIAIFESGNPCACKFNGPVACEDRFHCIRVLLAGKADIEMKNESGNTPLLCGADSGSYDLLELLIMNGADVNGQNNLGSTALHKTCALQDRESTELLLNNGADHTVTDMIGYAPVLLKPPETKKPSAFRVLRKVSMWSTHSDETIEYVHDIIPKSKHTHLLEFVPARPRKKQQMVYRWVPRRSPDTRQTVSTVY